MSSTAKWTDTEGINTLKKIVSRRIPQWPNGLYDFQLENIPRVLDGDKLLVFTATGDGKSSLYDVPLLVHLELAANPELYPPFPIRKNPIAVVVTPTKGLAESIIHEAKEFGLSGLSYCHERITEYTAKKINLAELICECKEWQLICVDPEHLATPKWQKILKSKVFLKNLLLFCIEEAHLIRSWGPGFRPHFESIGAIARGFIPEHVSIIGLSATCSPGTHTLAICHSLGMFSDSYHLIRRSNERINMQLIINTLKRKKGVSKFASILEYLRAGRKTIIHVNTIPEAYEIYEFLWSHIPSGTSPLHRMRMYHSLCTDEYNRETFKLVDTDPKLQVVIATVAFTQGINRKHILDSISFNFPTTLDEFWQAKGQAGRSPDVICRGIAIVPEKVIQNAKDFMRGENKKSKKKDAEDVVDMDQGKASFLAEELCLTGNINEYYGNPPLDQSRLDCRQANWKIYCALCCQRYKVQYNFMSPAITSISWLPLTITPPSKSSTPRKSRNSLGKDERTSMRLWMLDFRRMIWSEFEPVNPVLSHHPIAHFFSDSLIESILNNFLKIKHVDKLKLILEQHMWKYTDTKGDMLFRLIVDFQGKIHQRRTQECTRKNKQVGEDSSVNGDGDSGQEIEVGKILVDKPEESIPKVVSSVPRTRQARKPLQSMQEAAAEYGPARATRRR
ncbi:P-loop containing nucleoside triphosphate hydrolase protein [Dendrothele bispora CBS 962.96]|uniref:DNA 3'-5' helicase n=1 Tax=Dendrothele bispora (strain CBS 962.96) TaxID=1314807 RepID=A0A4S8KZU9_DENBC|nr:P-loop containing nucleoside triphosphate hydrolase protein [Dendrothele bispora CBS 962.96]